MKLKVRKLIQARRERVSPRWLKQQKRASACQSIQKDLVRPILHLEQSGGRGRRGYLWEHVDVGDHFVLDLEVPCQALQAQVRDVEVDAEATPAPASAPKGDKSQKRVRHRHRPRVTVPSARPCRPSMRPKRDAHRNRLHGLEPSVRYL